MAPLARRGRARRALSVAARALARALRTTGSMYGPFDPGQVFPNAAAGASGRWRDGRLTRAEMQLWEELVKRLH
ncbi:hypothetical protein [Kitasatospora aureofaciens]|uniref:hypothetical protein n=1 Tax=Kitasatospora aureofaciens TaxID=1894 RepID=UPI0037F969B8